MNDGNTVLQEVTVVGKLSKTPKKIIGTMRAESSLSGSIRSKAILVGKVYSNTPVLTGKVSVITGYDEYEGAYEVTPKVNSQMIETKDKLMYKDLIVGSIPYYEVSNSKGGTTIIIGGE